MTQDELWQRITVDPSLFEPYAAGPSDGPRDSV